MKIILVGATDRSSPEYRIMIRTFRRIEFRHTNKEIEKLSPCLIAKLIRLREGFSRVIEIFKSSPLARNRVHEMSGGECVADA